MKSRDLLLKVLVVAVLITAAVGATSAKEPEPAGALLMNHQMVDLAGDPVSLETYRGEVLVINFWASWCAPCLRELPILDNWNTTWQDTGARVIAISIDSKAANARAFVANEDLGLSVWLDGPQGLAAQLDLPAVPTSYVIDRAGRVVLRIEGSSPDDLARMQQKVQSLLSETDPLSETDQLSETDRRPEA